MKLKKYLCAFCVISLMAILLTVPAFAAGGDVAGAVEQTWDDAATQIKTVVDNVVFPALSMILAIAFFVKLGMSYFDYRTRGQFEWTGPAMLWLWELRDIGIIGVGFLLSVLALSQGAGMIPLVITVLFSFLTIRVDGSSILDFLRRAACFLILQQQYYEWRLDP